ncbi:MAG: ABC transporter substrate-binding protein [Candidatus Binatia bacterium]|nr:ABC transporter substrate-binding protein [Candidatus Binatia bacterium]
MLLLCTARIHPVFLLMLLLTACHSPSQDIVLTFSSSAVGAEAEVLQRQLARFMAAHQGIQVIQRVTPDAADQRRQLYVQWLNARAGEPDILQLDIIWTPEFAAAGWLLPLDSFAPPREAFFPMTIAANQWAGQLYALPWFVDVGMLYWRTDLLAGPPRTFDELMQLVTRARTDAALPFGFIWQGARYEGLVTVFLEYLGGFGGQIMDDRGRIVVDSPAAVRALTAMRDAIYRDGAVPPSVLTWQEEQVRFAFQNGQAVCMRNWPYAYRLLQDSAASLVAGKFSVALMPATADGSPTATLGGSQLAINAHTDHPQAAYQLIDYLTRPEQLVERARALGVYPPRPALYDGSLLAGVFPVPPDQVRHIIERAVPRPVTPVYAELSHILQIALHRALTRQQDPTAALADAARAMCALLERVDLSPQAGP